MAVKADLALLFSLLLLGCAAGRNGRVAAIQRAMERLRPLHTPLGEPKPGEWLYHHDEPGQTFEEYVAADPVGPTKARHTVYIQPLGDFSPAQRKVVDLTAEFIGLYYGLPVTVKDALPLSVIPAKARRTHPTWGVKQILSTYVLRKVLRPRLPDDAMACLAFTASDLWPGEGWNFVFGQASLRHRVGVWSIHRNGDPEAGPAEFRLCLLRTMKTGVHELGHMFSMRHCTAYECVMCGSNHRAEADSRPLAACPECAAKIWWITGADPADRYRNLAAFCKDHGLTEQAAFYETSRQALTAR